MSELSPLYFHKGHISMIKNENEIIQLCFSSSEQISICDKKDHIQLSTYPLPLYILLVTQYTELLKNQNWNIFVHFYSQWPIFVWNYGNRFFQCHYHAEFSANEQRWCNNDSAQNEWKKASTSALQNKYAANKEMSYQYFSNMLDIRWNENIWHAIGRKIERTKFE